MMIFSILKSLKSLIWVVLVLSMTFYLFGIIFVTAATSHMPRKEMWLMEENQGLVAFFGTVADAVLSLYMAMSGGRSWAEYYDVLKPLHIQYRLLFLMFITFSVFAVVNIVTGIFVDSALECTNTDRERMVYEELETKRRCLESMEDAFLEIDEDCNEEIGLEEFQAKMDDERVIAYFNALKLDVTDAATLFKLLDHDNSGQINIQEFLTGCYALQGESRSLDIKIMQLEMQKLQANFDSVAFLLHDIHDAMSTKSHSMRDWADGSPM